VLGVETYPPLAFEREGEVVVVVTALGVETKPPLAFECKEGSGGGGDGVGY
jgi:hypothetical protein